MKGLRSIVAMGLLTLAGGCASYSPYGIDEATIESHLADRLEDFSTDIETSGIPLTLTLNKADVAVGPEEREVVVIDFAGQLLLQVPRMPINLGFKIEGKPEYDKEERAIYVRNVRLLSSNIEAAGSAFNLGPLTGTFSDIISRFLDNHPVYRLDEDSGGARLYSLMNLKVAIQPGRIALVPAGNSEQADRPVR